MDLATAKTVTGGLLLGFSLLILGALLCFVFIMLRKRDKSPKPKKFNKSGFVFGGIGIVLCLIFAIIMVCTGTSDGVGTILGTMGDDSRAIYNDKYYVKTDLSFDGGSGKYKINEAESVLTGAEKLYTLKGYDRFDILVSMNSNVTGEIFVSKNDEQELKEYYSDLSKYSTGAVFDKQDKKLTTAQKDADYILYEKISDLDNYTETDEDNVKYADDIDSTKCCIFWATSDDELISEQVKLYPKDNNKKYIRVVNDKYYELDSSLTSEIDKYFE
ncbi:MAG: hypothetical protein ACI4RL_01490 [Ruminococcus sp.]